MQTAQFGDIVLGALIYRILPYLLGLSALLLHKDVITGELIRDLKSRNIVTVVWTVNDPTEKEYYRKRLGVAYMTDTLENYELDEGVLKARGDE